MQSWCEKEDDGDLDLGMIAIPQYIVLIVLMAPVQQQQQKRCHDMETMTTMMTMTIMLDSKHRDCQGAFTTKLVVSHNFPIFVCH